MTVTYVKYPIYDTQARHAASCTYKVGKFVLMSALVCYSHAHIYIEYMNVTVSLLVSVVYRAVL